MDRQVRLLFPGCPASDRTCLVIARLIGNQRQHIDAWFIMIRWGRKLVRCKSEQHIWAHGGQNTGNTCVLTKTRPRCYILSDLTKASFRATLHKTLCNFSQAERTSAWWVSLRCKIDGVLKVIRDARKNSPNHICPKRRSDFFFLIMYLEEKVEQEVKVFYLSRMQRPPCWLTFSPVWPALASVFKRADWVPVSKCCFYFVPSDCKSQHMSVSQPLRHSAGVSDRQAG